MKQEKVTFLFFMVFLFLSCGKDVLKENIYPKKKSKTEILYKSSVYKALNYKEKFEVSKQILRTDTLNNADKYLIFDKITFLYYKLNKIDSAIYYSKEMLILDFIKKNDAHFGKVNFKLGGYFNKKNQTDSAFYYYQKSKEYFFRAKDSLRVGKCLLNIAIIESNYGSYSKSDSTAVASIKFINGKRRRTTTAAYNCLAINSKERLLYKDAISYYRKAIDISKKKSSSIIYKNNLANVYKELKNYSVSISILEDLLKDSIGNIRTKARVIDNLAHIKWLNNTQEPILKDLLLAESMRIEEKDNYGLMASYNHLSDFFAEKDKIKSLLYANKMYEFSKKAQNSKDQIDAIEKIVALETPLKSIKYYQESIRLSDSLQKAETKQQYKFANIKYDYEEEEKQKLKFKTLASENKLIAEEENSQKKNILIIAVVFASGLLLLIFRRKQQHKKRLLQETYITETRIAKKLHDGLGNDIFKTLTKVQNPKYKPADIINDLDNIYLQTRAISHENDSIETGKDFDDYFRDLVASYNSDACKIILKDLASLDLKKLAKEKQIVLYRVFNELFVNMRKHSKATLVMLSCEKIKNQYQIIYVDNGIGFKENKIIFKNGLKNVETRIKTINGTITFENKPGKGLKVIFNFKK